MGRNQALLASHTLAFLLGFATAKLYDGDELNSYRNAYEKPMGRFRRYAGNATIGALGLGTLYVVVKISRMASRKEVL